MLPPSVYDELDSRLAPVDAALRSRYPGGAAGRQPVHTLYVSAAKVRPDLPARYGREALSTLARHGPLDFPQPVLERVVAKLAAEPVEDLRIDFEDGYGVVGDAVEDRAARAAARLVPALGVPFVGLRCKSLEAVSRRRAIRTLDVFLSALGPPPDGFRITLPKVSAAEQVAAMELLCGRLESTHGLPGGSLRFEVQVETPPAVLGSDGTATVAGIITAARGRLVGLHYGTYDYSAAIGVAAAHQSLEHPAADHAKAVLQVAAAGTGVALSDGSTNILPVGSTDQVRAAWALHARLVRRSLERGFYQGWDLHPAQLPTRYAATYAFYRESAPATVDRLRSYLDRRASGTLDEPATARAMAGFLLRGLRCGALDPAEVEFPVAQLEAL